MLAQNSLFRHSWENQIKPTTEGPNSLPYLTRKDPIVAAHLCVVVYSLFFALIFCSSEDMDGFWPVAIVVALVFGAIAGIRFSIPDGTITGGRRAVIGTNINGLYLNIA